MITFEKIIKEKMEEMDTVIISALIDNIANIRLVLESVNIFEHDDVIDIADGEQIFTMNKNVEFEIYEDVNGVSYTSNTVSISFM